MEKHIYKTEGVCSKQIEFDTENGKVYNVKFTGGCSGNLRAIGKLIEGASIETVIKILDGNMCGSRPTSCADQLAHALKEVK